MAEAARVLDRLVPTDEEVATDDGRWYIRRIIPYRTANDRIDGVVVTFTDFTRQKRAEESLAGELRAMTRLQELSRQVIASADLQQILETVLDAVIELNGADFGNIQLYDKATKSLRIAAQRGFSPRFLDHFASVDAEDGSTCGIALARRARVIVENVELDPAVASMREEARAAGYRAVQSTPLVSGSGETIGMVSTHFRLPHVFTPSELRLVDVYARQAADAIAAHLQQEALKRSEERLRKVLETDAVGVIFFDASGTLIDANGAFLQMTGYSREDVAAGALTWRTMTPPEWIQVSEEQFDALARTGHIGPYEKEYIVKDGSRTWMLFVGRSLGDGTVVEFCLDIGDRKRAEAEREMLARELSHRVKNTLAVVQSLANQADGTSRTVDEFRGKFLGRLRSLADAHTMLLDSHWQGADIRSLIEQSLGAYRVDDPQLVAIDGPSIRLNAKQTLGISLILHELATNAAKYGALSGQKGHVRVSWQIVDIGGARGVRLAWLESDGPRVEPPGEKGFGTRLIERVSDYELRGTAELDYAPKGLRCTLAFPLEEGNP